MVEKSLQGGVRIPTLRGENYDTVVGSEKALRFLLDEVGADRVVLGSDWPFVENSFVLEQQDNLLRMPHFSGERFAAMERGNAIGMFRRFARAVPAGG